MNLSEQATASHPAKSSSLPASMAPNICATTYCADFSHVIWWASGRTSAHVFSPVTCHPFLLVGLWRDSYIDLLYIFPNWVVESPTYTAKNQGFGHCSNGDWQDRTHIISWDLETHQLQLSGGFLKNWKNVVNAHKKSDLRWQKTDLSSQGMEGILSFRFFFRSKATKKNGDLGPLQQKETSLHKRLIQLDLFFCFILIWVSTKKPIHLLRKLSKCSFRSKPRDQLKG